MPSLNSQPNLFGQLRRLFSAKTHFPSFKRTLALWRIAIRGEERDYTRGPIGRSVFLLAVPMILELVMESVFAVVDIFFVSRLGAEAISVVV